MVHALNQNQRCEGGPCKILWKINAQLSDIFSIPFRSAKQHSGVRGAQTIAVMRLVVSIRFMSDHVYIELSFWWEPGSVICLFFLDISSVSANLPRLRLLATIDTTVREFLGDAVFAFRALANLSLRSWRRWSLFPCRPPTLPSEPGVPGAMRAASQNDE